MLIVVQLCDCAKTHQILYLKRANGTVCEVSYISIKKKIV